MRFLILTQYFPPETGAPQVRLANLVEQLVAAGHQVEVITALPNYPVGKIFPEYRRRLYCRETFKGIPVHRFWIYASAGSGLKRLLNYLSFALTSALGIFFASRPDIVFVESPPLFLSLPGRLLSLIWRCPFIFNVADLWPDSVREMGLIREGLLLRMADHLEAWSYRKAAFVSAVTDGIRNMLIERKAVPSEKALFLPNGADLELFRMTQGDVELAHDLGLAGKRVILYAGTLGLFQGLDVALEAAQLLQSEIADFMLVFVGGGSDRPRLEQLAKSKRLANVRFIDPQPPEMIPRLFAIATAGFASLKNLPLFEGARPSKLITIMASGKPVIYSGAGEGARLVLEAQAGFVTQPERAAELAVAFRAVLNNPGLAQQLGCNGRRFVEAHLSWRVLVHSWLAELKAKQQLQPQSDHCNREITAETST